VASAAIEEMLADKGANAMGQVEDQQKAALILDSLEVNKACEIIESLEQLEPEKVEAMLAQVSPAQADAISTKRAQVEYEKKEIERQQAEYFRQIEEKRVAELKRVAKNRALHDGRIIQKWMGHEHMVAFKRVQMRWRRRWLKDKRMMEKERAEKEKEEAMKQIRKERKEEVSAAIRANNQEMEKRLAETVNVAMLNERMNDFGSNIKKVMTEQLSDVGKQIANSMEGPLKELSHLYERMEESNKSQDLVDKEHDRLFVEVFTRIEELKPNPNPNPNLNWRSSRG